VTVIHNGVWVHKQCELLGGTCYDRPPKYSKHPEKQPIHIQYHGNPVKFRNSWVRELKPIVGKKPEKSGDASSPAGESSKVFQEFP
jgi:hypothetical protein